MTQFGASHVAGKNAARLGFELAPANTKAYVISQFPALGTLLGLRVDLMGRRAQRQWSE